MINEEIRKKIADAGYENALLYDSPSFDNSIIGIDEDGKVVYDYDKMADEFVDENLEDGLEPEERYTEAYEFIDYNTIRATPYFGVNAPVVIRNNEYMSDEAESEYTNVINGEPYTKIITTKL